VLRQQQFYCAHPDFSRIEPDRLGTPYYFTIDQQSPNLIYHCFPFTVHNAVEESQRLSDHRRLGILFLQSTPAHQEKLGHDGPIWTGR
jgi:hypothetical protein